MCEFKVHQGGLRTNLHMPEEGAHEDGEHEDVQNIPKPQAKEVNNAVSQLEGERSAMHGNRYS